VLDTRARATAEDAELRGRAGVFAWRLGGGADQASATGGIAQARGRAFATTNYSAQSSAGAIDVGARVDAIGAFHTLPSFSLAGERSLVGTTAARTSWSVAARLAQAVRVPTLYDLYFASPQRLFVRTLDPERVRVDAELSTRFERRVVGGTWMMQGSLVARDTRDAIVWFPGNFGWSPANVGMERLRGAEARAQWRTNALDASAWVTAYDAVLTSGALRIPSPYVARIAGGASLRADFRSTTVSIIARGMGRRPFTAGPRDSAFELPAVLLGDIAIARRVPLSALLRTTEALVSLSLENAMDTAWQSVRGYPSPGRSWAVSTTLRHHSQP
jgi:outer membrane cobalamin receptor